MTLMINTCFTFLYFDWWCGRLLGLQNDVNIRCYTSSKSKQVSMISWVAVIFDWTISNGVYCYGKRSRNSRHFSRRFFVMSLSRVVGHAEEISTLWYATLAETVRHGVLEWSGEQSTLTRLVIVNYHPLQVHTSARKRTWSSQWDLQDYNKR